MNPDFGQKREGDKPESIRPQREQKGTEAQSPSPAPLPLRKRQLSAETQAYLSEGATSPSTSPRKLPENVRRHTTAIASSEAPVKVPTTPPEKLSQAMGTYVRQGTRPRVRCLSEEQTATFITPPPVRKRWSADESPASISDRLARPSTSPQRKFENLSLLATTAITDSAVHIRNTSPEKLGRKASSGVPQGSARAKLMSLAQQCAKTSEEQTCFAAPWPVRKRRSTAESPAILNERLATIENPSLHSAEAEKKPRPQYTAESYHLHMNAAYASSEQRPSGSGQSVSLLYPPGSNYLTNTLRPSFDLSADVSSNPLLYSSGNVVPQSSFTAPLANPSISPQDRLDHPSFFTTAEAGATALQNTAEFCRRRSSSCNDIEKTSPGLTRFTMTGLQLLQFGSPYLQNTPRSSVEEQRQLQEYAAAIREQREQNFAEAQASLVRPLAGPSAWPSESLSNIQFQSAATLDALGSDVKVSRTSTGRIGQTMNVDFRQRMRHSSESSVEEEALFTGPSTSQDTSPYKYLSNILLQPREVSLSVPDRSAGSLFAASSLGQLPSTINQPLSRIGIAVFPETRSLPESFGTDDTSNEEQKATRRKTTKKISLSDRVTNLETIATELLRREENLEKGIDYIRNFLVQNFQVQQ